MKTLTQLFPNASQSVQAANPQLLPYGPTKAKLPPYSSRMLMNKTESEFAHRLEIMKLNGEILRYEYEGITLRWGGIRYTPDFVVFSNHHKIIYCDVEGKIVGNRYCPTFIEVKGAFIGGKFERAVERFRHARTFWPQFSFELHQRTKQGWKRIY